MQSCTITVNPPPTVFCPVISAAQSSAINPVTLLGSGGSTPYTFLATGLPNGLSASLSGVISGTPTVNGTFPYTLSITDKLGQQGSINCGMIVTLPLTAACPVITAVQSVAITPVTLAGSGGIGAPYTFSATGLPNGLTISPDGRISGTPTVSGNFPYAVTIADRDGNKGTLNCSVTVNGPPTAACVSIQAVEYAAITPATLVGGAGAGAPYTFSATGLPTGLSISSGGVISATPTVNGTFPYTVTITDKAANKGTLSCSVTVMFVFTGFFKPVANPSVVNIANAGVAIPVKFSLGGNQGLNILASNSPSSAAMACPSAAATAVISQTVTGGTSALTYDTTTGQYTYTWKTDKSWAGSCRLFTMQLTDGTSHTAYFQLK